MKMLGLKKCRLIATILISVILIQCTYAGHFIDFFGVTKYVCDDETFAVGWRWIDTNNDGLCECYRFDYDGTLVTDTVIKGKEVNSRGQWVVNGVVQQVFKSTGVPLKERSAMLEFEDNNNYIDMGTMSTTKRINATTKDIKALMDADTATMSGPRSTYERPEEGFLYGRGVKAAVDRRPVATMSSWGIIADALKEEETIYVSATESIIAGRDVRKFVTASNKYTEKSDGVKIYGGDKWDDAMTLQGNGAYIKLTTNDSKSKFKANYFTAEVAHQTHGESTADTYCGIEVYVNGSSVDFFDGFCDDDPEKIEVWLDEDESNLELRAVVTGDAPGRKIYLRNARFRQVKDKND